jgi:hypothetical protein
LKKALSLKEYERLKKEIDILIANTNNRTRLAAEVSTLEDDIRWKSDNLKNLVRDIERAKEHYNTLLAFLRTVGVDGRQSRFTLDVNFLLSQPQRLNCLRQKSIANQDFNHDHSKL